MRRIARRSGGGLLPEMEVAGEVHVQMPLPLLVRDLQEGGRVGDTGVSDHNIERCDALEDGAHGLAIADIDPLEANEATLERVEKRVGARSLCPVWRADIEHGDGGAASHEVHRHRPADIPTSPGHHHMPGIETGPHDHHPPLLDVLRDCPL
jgi:hypothetical protein